MNEVAYREEELRRLALYDRLVSMLTESQRGSEGLCFQCGAHVYVWDENAVEGSERGQSVISLDAHDPTCTLAQLLKECHENV